MEEEYEEYLEFCREHFMMPCFTESEYDNEIVDCLVYVYTTGRMGAN